MAKIIKRTKKDGTCSYCIRVSNGYDRQGRQVLVNRTFTPPPGLTGKKLEKELQRQADAFEQEVHSGISLDASMKLDDLIERWFTEYADRQLKPKTATEYRKLVPRVSAALGHMNVWRILRYARTAAPNWRSIRTCPRMECVKIPPIRQQLRC